MVASAYGLALDDRWQRSILPFRDSYQTGALLSTLVALGYRARIRDELARSLNGARIYEVGSTVTGGPESGDATCADSACANVHPQRDVPSSRHAA